MQNPPYWERFWSNVDATGDCWEWMLGRTTTGYGKVKIEGRTMLPHRVSWTLLVGPIPQGLEMDHLCRNRTCVNPDHLEPVERRTNLLRGFNFVAMNARKTECPLGHALIGENLYESSKARFCKKCYRRQKAEAGRAKRRALRG